MATTTVQFISVQTLKEKSVIQQNVDEKILSTAITEFQELELEDILGAAELERLTAAIIAANQVTDPVPLSAGDELLLTHIRKVMIYGSLMYSIAPIKIRFSNKGLQELTDDHAKAAAAQEARANYAFKLEGYKKKLIKYLKDAITTTTSADCDDDGGQDTTFQFTGVYIPDKTFDRESYYKNTYYKTGGYIIIN